MVESAGQLVSSNFVGFSSDGTTSAKEQAFALQYTAVILIVMTFVIGAFVRPHLPVLQTSPDAPSIKSSIGQLKIGNVFSQGSSELDANLLQSIITFANSHDVDLKISVFADTGETAADGRITLALARSVSLYKHLLDSGLTPYNLVINASSEQSQTQVEIDVIFTDATSTGGRHVSQKK